MMGVTRERDKGGGTLEHEFGGADNYSSLNKTTLEKAPGVVTPRVESLSMDTNNHSVSSVNRTYDRTTFASNLDDMAGSKSFKTSMPKVALFDNPNVTRESDEQVNDGLKAPTFTSKVGSTSATRKVNFRTLDTGKPLNEKDEVKIPLSSVLEANSKFDNTLFGYFIGKRVAFPVVDNYVKNAWKKFGVVRSMMNSKGLFFFKFASIEGLNGVLENGPWFIRSVPIILKKWIPRTSFIKEDLGLIPVWVKIHDIPIASFTEDGLSAMATKLGTPIMLDAYTSFMCLQSWGRFDYARALIDIKADQELKGKMVITVPSWDGEGEVLHTVRVEYEWKPPRCGVCMVFGHDETQCPKRVPVNLKHQAQKNDGFQMPQRKAFHGIEVGKEVEFNPSKHKKQVYQPVSKKPDATKKKITEVASTSGTNIATSIRLMLLIGLILMRSIFLVLLLT